MTPAGSPEGSSSPGPRPALCSWCRRPWTMKPSGHLPGPHSVSDLPYLCGCCCPVPGSGSAGLGGSELGGPHGRCSLSSPLAPGPPCCGESVAWGVPAHECFCGSVLGLCPSPPGRAPSLQAGEALGSVRSREQACGGPRSHRGAGVFPQKCRARGDGVSSPWLPSSLLSGPPVLGTRRGLCPSLRLARDPWPFPVWPEAPPFRPAGCLLTSSWASGGWSAPGC